MLRYSTNTTELRIFIGLKFTDSVSVYFTGCSLSHSDDSSISLLVCPWRFVSQVCCFKILAAFTHQILKNYLRHSEGAFTKLRKMTTSFVTSVRLSVCLKNAAPTGRIFMKYYIWGVFENMLRKFRYPENVTLITGTLHENLWTFMISCWVLVRMRNISDGSCRGNQTHIWCSVTFFFSENRVFYETMWEKYCTARQANGDNI